MKKYLHIIYIITLLLSILIGWYGFSLADKRKMMLVEQQSKEMQLILENDEWELAVDTLKKRHKEEIKYLEDKLKIPPKVEIKEVLREVIKTKEVPVEVPYEVVVEASCPLKTEEDKLQFHLSNEVRLRVDMLPNSRLVWKGIVTNHLRFNNDKTLLVQNPISDDSFIYPSTLLSKALYEYNNKPPKLTYKLRPIKYSRLGWSAGIGCVINSDPSCGGIIVYGLQF